MRTFDMHVLWGMNKDFLVPTIWNKAKRRQETLSSGRKEVKSMSQNGAEMGQQVRERFMGLLSSASA